MHRARLAVLVLLGCAPAARGAAPPATSPEPGRVFLTQEEALELAFPKCKIERGSLYLTKAQLELAEKLAGAPIETAILHPYAAYKQGKPVGTAYFDTHKVRSMRETLMIVVDPEGRVARLEILAFGEPLEYLPRGNWYAQFLGKPLSDELDLKRDIRGITGASLSARATTGAVRRVLALHAAVQPKEAPLP